MPNLDYVDFATRFPKTAKLFSNRVEDESSTTVMVLPPFMDGVERIQPLVICGDKENPWGEGVQRMALTLDSSHPEFGALVAVNSPN